MENIDFIELCQDIVSQNITHEHIDKFAKQLHYELTAKEFKERDKKSQEKEVNIY